MATPEPSAPSVILRDAATGRWLLFEHPLEVIETADCAAAPACLRRIEEAVNGQNLYAAGAIAYEAAPSFDPALRVIPPPPRAAPLLWFALFPAPRPFTLPSRAAVPFPAWHPSVTPDAYRAAFNRIKRHIREGDAYQVNLTYRLRAQAPAPQNDESPLARFSSLAANQQAAYGVFISTPGWSLCSASPELFFSLSGTRLESRPMKGTAPRGLSPDEDRALAERLLSSEKDRAENLMIVDMVRNDLGRVATPGSVTAPELFTLERYPTVWQLTSTVRAETQASVADIFAALFPAASITGAPKSRAMRIIAENECGPRGFYTGAAGFIAPGRSAQFNVSIRSLFIDHASGRAEYGTGGGIVWDSECEAEQAECRTKALILNAPAGPFSLLETMLWTPAGGVWLQSLHLARLAASADYFSIALDLASVRQRLDTFAGTRPPVPHRIRLLVSQDGAVTLETAPFTPAAPDAPPLRVALAPHPIERSDRFLYHKTTRRRVYEEALAACPGYDDVLLWNDAGEVTESTRANVIAEIGGAPCTPPVSCGLLPGTLRHHLLDTGALTERVITVDELLRAPRVSLINSLRGTMAAQVVR